MNDKNDLNKDYNSLQGARYALNNVRKKILLTIQRLELFEAREVELEKMVSSLLKYEKIYGRRRYLLKKNKNKKVLS